MKPISADTVRHQARSQWHSILPAIGIPAQALRNQHQPCPCCGGRDRFRFDDKEGRGTFICSHYGNGGGDGFDLVMHWLQCDFQAALRAVAQVLGMADLNPSGGNQSELRNEIRPHANAAPMPPERVKDHLAALVSIWGKTQSVRDSDPAAAYLQHRGLDWAAISGICADALRFHPALQYWAAPVASGRPQCVGEYPAMVGNITDNSGQMQGLHCTYLQTSADSAGKPTVGKLALAGADGQALPAKKMRSRFSGSLKGGAIRLFSPENGTLAVCEGIETALAVRQCSGLPVWACLSANGLQSLVLPESVQELFIYCDNDSHGQGHRAGQALALRAQQAGITCRLWLPEQSGFDALDVLNHSQGAAA